MLFLSPASISYLNQFLLALIITAYLVWRLYFQKKRQQPFSEADRLLTLFFIAVTVFSLGLFLDSSLLPTERLRVVYLLNTILALMLIALLQLAYAFPQPDEKQSIERRLALAVSGAYALTEAGIAVWRFSLLRQAQVIFRPPEMDYLPVILFAWVVFAFARGTTQNWRNPAVRRFAFIFLIPLMLATLNVVRSYAGISTPLYHISMSVGILATIFLFAFNYLNAQPESTSLMVKISGAVLTSMLAFIGTFAWLVTPAYAAQYHPPLLDYRSIRFTPNEDGGYNVAEIPFQFESERGQKLDITDESDNRLGYVPWTFDFPFYNRRYSQVFISNNGLISFGQPMAYWSLEYRLSDIPIFFALYLDLNPELSPAGGIYLREEADRLIVTYDRLRAFYYPEEEYTFQVVLHADGRIDLTYNGLADGVQYQVNDRPDASPWVIGLKPGLDSGETVNFAALPLTIAPEGAVDDQYRAFRQYIHAFLLPLTIAILASSLLLLAGLPLLTLITIARPLQALVTGVEQFDRDQQRRHIPVQFHDEIGFLTQSFNTLTGALDDLIHNLERRVADRTADLQNANAELRKLSVAVEQSPSAIIITNPQIEIEYVNKAFTLSTGYTFDEVKGLNPRLLKSGQTPPETFKEMWGTLKAGQIWRGELVNRRKNGEVYWEYTVIAPIHDSEGNITHYVAVKEDVTARKAAEAKLEELAVTDPLTGLLNRRGFFQEAEKLYARSTHPPYLLAALMMDIDHFKDVNDRYGHQAGDAVLREVAARIRDNLRPTDIVARHGGEEFVALLPRTSLVTLEQIACRLNIAVQERPIEIDDISITMTISIGGAGLTAQTRSLDELLTQADKSMYRAKNKGRNCFVLWHE
ncbi:MAG: diguanylate cyclase [Chloroflexota bacterium]